MRLVAARQCAVSSCQISCSYRPHRSQHDLNRWLADVGQGKGVAGRMVDARLKLAAGLGLDQAGDDVAVALAGTSRSAQAVHDRRLKPDQPLAAVGAVTLLPADLLSIAASSSAPSSMTTTEIKKGDVATLGSESTPPPAGRILLWTTIRRRSVRCHLR